VVRIALKKLGIGAGVGILDIATEKIDESQGLVAPMNTRTAQRVGLFAAGLIGSLFAKSPSWIEALETVMVAEEPLVIRSLANLGGLIADYAEAPSREAIELRLRSSGQQVPRQQVQFR